MNLVWNIEGVNIPSVSMNRWEGQQMWTSGIGYYHIPKDVQKMHPRPFQWEATVTPQGWYIVITASTGKVGEVQGTTFNLPLEISVAVRRLL